MTPTDAEFRASGYTGAARNFPLSDAGARWIAEWNGVGFEIMPAAWRYAPNAGMHAWIEKLAALGIPATQPCPVMSVLP